MKKLRSIDQLLFFKRERPIAADNLSYDLSVLASKYGYIARIITTDFIGIKIEFVPPEELNRVIVLELANEKRRTSKTQG
jgi:hypothetical protein